METNSSIEPWRSGKVSLGRKLVAGIESSNPQFAEALWAVQSDRPQPPDDDLSIALAQLKADG